MDYSAAPRSALATSPVLRTLTAFGGIHVQVAVTVTHAHDPVAIVDHLDGDVVVVYAFGARVDARKAVPAGVVVVVGEGSIARAGAAVASVVGTLSPVVVGVAVSVPWM